MIQVLLSLISLIIASTRLRNCILNKGCSSSSSYSLRSMPSSTSVSSTCDPTLGKLLYYLLMD